MWVFFVFSALQPVVRQKMLEGSRLRALHRFERARRSRVIALVHRQETMSLLGFPLMRYIDVNDSEEVLRAIKLTDPDMPIDLIIHTPGGLVLAANQITHALKRRRAKVTVFVPHYAMSGGTLIALAADEIRMDEELLADKMSPEAAAALATRLASGTWTHDYGITFEGAKALGLPVSAEVPNEVYEFMSLFPQPTRMRPSVEYVPLPYRHAREGTGGSKG
jgi:ClpP class serine protease